MAGGEVIHQHLRGKLQSHSAVSAVPPFMCVVSGNQLKWVTHFILFSSKKFHEDAGSVGMKSLKTFATIASADEAENGLAFPNYPWPHEGILSS
ncbi:hypothetical protein Pint_21921 [Pistacia integerrima]|uniref:Uncharacterized protein n=1 Tax=Pistacia integerrima TaxID=434235 RepID=A0ACC0YLX1_9ROSI|nr:hypothetical protein Pint_21921 [Pistacia integerrima]